MKSFESLIAQAPSSPPAIPTPDSFTEWGVFGAVAYLVVKEAINLFKNKEESESKLTTNLIEDLRNTNQALQKQQSDTLLQVQVIQAKTSAMIEEMKKIVTDINSSYQQGRRDTSVIIVETRAIHDKLVVQDVKLDALHARLDGAGKRDEPQHRAARD